MASLSPEFWGFWGAFRSSTQYGWGPDRTTDTRLLESRRFQEQRALPGNSCAREALALHRFPPLVVNFLQFFGSEAALNATRGH